MLLAGCLLGFVGGQLGQNCGGVAVHEDGPNNGLLAAPHYTA